MVIPNPGNCLIGWRDTNGCFRGTGKESISLFGIRALIIPFDNAASDKEYVALPESDTLFTPGFF